MTDLVTRTRTDLSGLHCSAVFSHCERFRYELTWVWDRSKPILTLWLLNPSTADHEKLDPTVQGLVKRARHWGYGGARVINLFAFRATRPRDMLAVSDPVGPHNDAVSLAALHQTLDAGVPVICGWGAHGGHRGRDQVARAMAAQLDVRLMALELNADGSPRHPLYIAHTVRPIIWA